MCARVVTRHTAGLLQSRGVKRLVLSSNPNLGRLAAEANWDVACLEEIECTEYLENYFGHDNIDSTVPGVTRECTCQHLYFTGTKLSETPTIFMPKLSYKT